jgi:hypothetical protein
LPHAPRATDLPRARRLPATSPFDARRVTNRCEVADDGASAIDAAGYLDALRTRSSNVPTSETTPTPIEPIGRHRRLIVIAVAAAAVPLIVVIGAVALARHDRTQPVNDRTPPATDATQNTVIATAAKVAKGFVEAYGAFDTDRAFSYLADDADITGLIDGFTTQEVRGTQDELRLVIALLEAQHYQQTHDSCLELSSSATGTRVRCTFEFQSLRSDELGFGPYSGNYFDLTVQAGQIVRGSSYLETDRFSPQVWEPFSFWMEHFHSREATIIYSPTTADGGMGVSLTEGAIPLWDQLTREYVGAKAVG